MRTQDFCQVKKETRYYSTLLRTRQRLDQIKMHLHLQKETAGGEDEVSFVSPSPPSSLHADAGAGQQARRAVDGWQPVLGASPLGLFYI
jgi:hypothetical protein